MAKFFRNVYFPQFKVHLEIDEEGHKNTIQKDKLREILFKIYWT